VADIWQSLEMTLPPEPVAADLMSSPVRTIEADAPVADAVRLLNDYGHSALVVTRNGRLAGIVSRRDLDRASRHGLRGTEVRHVMTSTVVTTGPNTSLSDILAIFVKRDIGRLPVMRQDAMLGIVTRSDVIRAQYDQAPDRREAVARKTVEMSERLQAYWPSDWLAAFEKLSEAAQGKPVYLVGGAVRDLMLDRQNLDADFVIEGDAIALAEALATRITGATYKGHEAFGTAHVYLPDGKVIDLASARTEHYERPGALPRVALSSIKQDLARRDFSINCLAIRIDHAGHGELIDFFGAQADLTAKELRVLHNLSFIEDPTRVLRAVRFEQTLGFRMENRTEDFARFAFATGTFDGLGGERNKLELARLLSLPDPLAALQRLADLGALRLLRAGLVLDTPTRQRLRRLKVLLRRLPLETGDEGWLAWLATLLYPADPLEVRAVGERLHLAGRQIEQLVTFQTVVKGEVLSQGAPLAVVEMLRPLSTPVLAGCYACAPGRRARRAIVKFYTRWQHIHLTVSGRDLKVAGVPPGPAYKQLLNEILALRLEGKLEAAQELGCLQRLAQESGNADVVQ
jgi:tRNA nucleotidyltransferase (CCA-adding enzyme)